MTMVLLCGGVYERQCEFWMEPLLSQCFCGAFVNLFSFTSQLEGGQLGKSLVTMARILSSCSRAICSTMELLERS